MVQRETARLRAILERALLVVSTATGGATGAYACDEPSGAGPDDAAVDATAGDTGLAASRDAASEPGEAEAGPTWAPGCVPTAPVEYDAGVDAPECEYRVTLPCGLPSFVTSLDPIHCGISLADCLELCTGPAFPFLNCEVANGYGCDDDAEAFVAADGAAIVIQCDKCTIVGRRPGGLALPRIRRTGIVGAYLAGASYLEAASVRAFEVLGEELGRLGAPRALVAAARRSAGDEVRHARVTARLARGHGAEPPRLRVASSGPRRSLREVAVENAVEGCVRETFGALLAVWQGRHAADPGIARVMGRIAVDETRHAALAWAVARWAEPRLDARSRSAVFAARRSAVRALERETRTPVPRELVDRAGLPSAGRAGALFAELRRGLWEPPLSGEASAPR